MRSAIFLLAAPLSHAGQLVFLNGDRVAGTLAGGEGTTHLLWKLPGSDTPTRVPVSTIHKVSFSDQAPPEEQEQNVSMVLSNGDSLHGKLLSLNDNALSVESSSFGRLEVPRTMIQDLTVNEGGYYLLAGAGSSKDWFVDKKGSWKVLNGTLRASDYGVLGRDMPKAHRIRVDFEVTTQDSGVGFTVHLFATNKQVPARDSNYAIQFSGAYVYARKTMRTEEAGGLFGRGGAMNQETLGEPRRLDRPPGPNPVRVTIFADGRAGVILLHIDGQLVHRWDDPRGFGEKPGSAIGFASNSQSTEIRGLTVARWNGSIGEETEESPRAETTDLVFTANDDQITGLVTGVKDGGLAIESEHFGPMSIPTDRIQRVRLATIDREQARRMDGDVRATFQRGGQITLKLSSLDNRHLTGHSENTGEARIAIDSLREMVFNLYTEKYPDPESLNARDPAKLLEPPW